MLRGKKLAYVFDFGDEWRVLLTLKTIRADDGRAYPLVLAAVGDPPRQYPLVLAAIGDPSPGYPGEADAA